MADEFLIFFQVYQIVQYYENNDNTTDNTFLPGKNMT